MNILLIEDNESYQAHFIKVLSKIGVVTAFKSSNQTRKFLRDTEIQFDLVVCDHNILRFESENSMAEGTEIYFELRWMLESEVPFVHFSLEPCPKKYDGSNADKNFYSIAKSDSVDLIQFLMEKGLIKP